MNRDPLSVVRDPAERLRLERGAEPPSESAWGWGPTRSEESGSGTDGTPLNTRW